MTEQHLPLVAIVGRPNVGKSTLYNRLVGGRPALVHDTPGLTRDRRYGEIDYYGRGWRIVDTGGLDPDAANEVIGAGIHRQALRAIGEADAMVLVVDGRAGVSAIDHQLARQLRATGKPVFLAINKIDHSVRDDLVHEFHELGLTASYPVSAAHGRGIDTLLEAITEAIDAPKIAAEAEEPERDLLMEPPTEAEEIEAGKRERERDAASGPLRVAFVGRPNAGKSALTNRLLGEERSLVHHEAGTTTDPVDSPFTIGDRSYVLIDTAGIRRKAKIDVDIEKLAVTMALGAVARADVAVLVIDAALGPAEQDARIAGKVEESGRALVIALNKSDLVVGSEKQAALRDADRGHVPLHAVGAGHVAVGAARRWCRSPARCRRSRGGRASPADSDLAAQPVLRGGDRRDAAAAASRPRGQDPLPHASRDPAADVHPVGEHARWPRAELQALPREPPARSVRVSRHAAAHLRQGAQRPAQGRLAPAARSNPSESSRARRA